MSKENTTPAEEIKEVTAVTDAAEEAADETATAPEAETEAAEAEAELAAENTEDEAPADDAAEAETEVQAEGETASEDTEAEEAEDSDSEEAQAEESAEAESEPAPKKPLSFGLGLGIGIAVAAIVAIVFAAIMLIPKFTGPASAVEEYIQAYKDADYEAYFSKDYSVMYNYDDLQERVEQAKQYGDDTGAEGLETKVLKTVSLSEDVKDSLKSQLETAGYKDIDKIQDMTIVLLEVSRPSDTDSSKRDYWVSSFYGMKVDGDWYFTTGF